MKITYTHCFFSECPNNGAVIEYTLVIESERPICVENIVTACAIHRRGFHEQIASALAAQFLNTKQTLSAHHHGVDIETICE